MKKTKKDFEKYILSIVNKYSDILLLQRNTFEVEYESETQYMACRFNQPYLGVTILYSDLAYTNWKDGEDMKHAIIHEMCHVITDPFYMIASNRFITNTELEYCREQMTDHIANLILKNDL